MKNKLEEVHTLLLKTKLSYKRYNLLLLSQVYIVEHHSGVFTSFNFTNFIKKISFENLVKCFLFKVKSKRIKNKSLDFDYLFINEVNNKPVIETLEHVENQFPEQSRAGLISDNRLASENKLQINIFQFANFLVLLKTFAGIAGMVPKFHRHRKEIKELACHFNISPALLIFNCFDSIFLVNVLEACFAKVSAKKMVFISDVHKISRITSLYGGMHGISTFVLQHGATVGGYGYLPVLSDRMLVWGTLSKKWFIDREQDEKKLVVCGSPRMDGVKYPGQDLPVEAGITSVLVVMSEMLYEMPFLQLIRDAFVHLNLPGVEIRIKLHPTGAADFSGMVDNVFAGSGLKYEIFKQYDLKKLLRDSSMVFVTTSSVGMEAIIFNKPILQYKTEKFSYIKMSYEDYNCSHIFKSSAEIVEIIAGNGKLRSKLTQYPLFVEDYFYKLDGNSSLRAKEFIESFDGK